MLISDEFSSVAAKGYAIAYTSSFSGVFPVVVRLYPPDSEQDGSGNENPYALCGYCCQQYHIPVYFNFRFFPTTYISE